MEEIKSRLEQSFRQETYIDVWVEGKKFRGIVFELPCICNYMQYRLHKKMNTKSAYIYFKLENVQSVCFSTMN